MTQESDGSTAPDKSAVGSRHAETEGSFAGIVLGDGDSIAAETSSLKASDVVEALRDMADPLSVARPDGPRDIPRSIRNLAFESASGFSFPREDLGEDFYDRARRRSAVKLPKLIPMSEPGSIADLPDSAIPPKR